MRRRHRRVTQARGIEIAVYHACEVTREFFINVDFDLSLRPGWRPEESAGCRRPTFEMALHMLAIGGPGDGVLVSSHPAGGFLAYLESCEIPVAAPTLDSSVRTDARFVPFGWNAEAARRNRQYMEPVVHPPLDVVREVNGRSFAARLQATAFADRTYVGTASDVSALVSLIEADGDASDGWVLKAEHGNAALGNRRVRAKNLMPEGWEVARRLLETAGSVAVERWHDRMLDIAAVFDLGNDGSIRNLEVHEVVNTADGAFIGSIYDSGSAILAPWHSGMVRAAEVVAEALTQAGYFGPVCIDGYVWRDGEGPRLRSLVDVNARLHVSAPALRLWRIWGEARVVYWRFFTAKKLRLPADHRRFAGALGRDAYDPRTRRGVAATSPFQLADGRSRPRKVGMLFVGDTRAEVLVMERRVRDRFES